MTYLTRRGIRPFCLQRDLRNNPEDSLNREILHTMRRLRELVRDYLEVLLPPRALEITKIAEEEGPNLARDPASVWPNLS